MSTPGTVNYPGSLDDVISLFEVSNNAITALAVAAGSGDATLNVVSTSLFPSTGAITVDAEIIYYTGKTSTTFTGCIRGRDGTAAASHLINVTVSGFITARHFAAIRDALIATETASVGAQTITGAKTFTPGSGTVAIAVTAGQINSSSQFRSRAKKAAAQSLASGQVNLTWDTNVQDVGGVHSTSSNPTRFTVPVGGAGLWCVSGQLGIVTGGGNIRGIFVLQNTVEIARNVSPIAPGGFNTDINVTVFIAAADGDFFEFAAFQDSGGALNSVAAESFGAVFKVY